MAHGKAIAYANNDVVQIGWSVDAKIPGCLGFAVYRLPADADVPEEPLTSHVGFDDGDSSTWIAKPTTQQPIAAFRWRDLAPSREKPVRYKVVAMQGPPDNPQPMPGFEPLITPPVNATETYGNVRVYFNRGVLSTQHLSRALITKGEKPSSAAILKFIGNEGDALRLGLTGELLEGLTSIIRRANTEGGKCYASLYELTDKELIGLLAGLDQVEVVLSNNGTGDKGEPYDKGNTAAAAALKDKQVFRRYMPKGQIGHNKFVVYVGPDNQPKAVVTGSTNWTATGLCTQSNNCIVIESPELAQQYLDYWHALKDDAEAAGIPDAPAPMSKIQGKTLRDANAQPRPAVSIPGGPSVQVWFSPNMPGLLRKTPKLPPDLKTLFDLCEQAEQAVLFLCFQPGGTGSPIPTIVKFLSGVSERKPALLIRGVISDQAEAEEFMRFRDPDEDADVIAPAGILDGFAAWEKEFYKAGNAIVHDKICVIDPFSDKCVVATGSHNLGYRASHNNDENMVILRGDQRIAQAYATHVFDIYNHYRWRYYQMQKAQRLADKAWRADGAVQERKKNFPASKFFHQVIGWKHNEPNDKWQDRYFDPASMASLERQFWVSEGAPLLARTPTTAITTRLGDILTPGVVVVPAPARGKAATGGKKAGAKKAAAPRARKGTKTTGRRTAKAKTTGRPKPAAKAAKAKTARRKPAAKAKRKPARRASVARQRTTAKRKPARRASAARKRTTAKKVAPKRATSQRK